jgi:hypothetical protein
LKIRALVRQECRHSTRSFLLLLSSGGMAWLCLL